MTNDLQLPTIERSADAIAGLAEENPDMVLLNPTKIDQIVPTLDEIGLTILIFDDEILL
jgi:hypothetical protein